MNLNKFRRYVIHRWNTGDGECYEKVHYSCFRGTKDKYHKRFYRDDMILFHCYGHGNQYEEWEKIKRTDKKVRHRNR